MLIRIVLFVVLARLCFGRKGFGSLEQEWGYTEVRPGVSMFWWLFYTTTAEPYFTFRPLIVWLGGVIGVSATGYGVFDEIGPYTRDCNISKHSWVTKANILFVDTPAGTGFGKVESFDGFAQNDKQVVNDLVTLLKDFYQSFPQFKYVPLIIAGESYGSRIASMLALNLQQDFHQFDLNLKGVLLISPWISPSHNVRFWGDYLENMGFINDMGLDRINQEIDLFENYLQWQLYHLAAYQYYKIIMAVLNETTNIDFYNVLTKMDADGFDPEYKETKDSITELMQKQVKTALNLHTNYSFQNFSIFYNLKGDFMKSTTEIVEKLLSYKNINVYVVSGQFSLYINVPGTTKWINELNWSQSSNWKHSDREFIVLEGVMEGFQKIMGNLGYFCILRAGQMVPIDNPLAMNYILDQLIFTSM